LTSRPAGLLQQETRIRSLTGVEIGTRYFVVEGKTPEMTLQAEERLVARLRQLSLKGELANFQAISSFVPSAARQEDNRALLRKTIHSDGKLLEQAFEHVGLRNGVAGELERAYQQSEGRLLTPEAWLATPGAAPFRHLWLGKTESGYTSVVIPIGAKSAEPLAALATDLPGVSFVDKAASVSRLFSEYRKGLSYGLIAAMVLVLGLLSWRYGRNGGAGTLLPAGLGIAAALAGAGYMGSPITVFSMMALMLVLGVGVNYSIFLMEGRTRPGTTGVAVVLSASTTVLSFGLLAFSGTPALSGFGTMLLVGIAVTVLATPLALSLSTATQAK
jgi:predicted exporter